MFYKSPRKLKGKINEGTANPKVPINKPIGKNIRRKTIFAVICILVIFVLGAVTENFDSNKTLVYASSIKSIGAGIYWDQACTNRTLSLDWGPIEAGSNKTLTIYIKNEDNSAISLWLSTSKWAPTASFHYMSLNWNYSGQVITVEEVIPLELTLTVNPTIVGITSFSFDTIITTTSES